MRNIILCTALIVFTSASNLLAFDETDPDSSIVICLEHGDGCYPEGPILQEALRLQELQTHERSGIPFKNSNKPRSRGGPGVAPSMGPIVDDNRLEAVH